MALLRNLPLSRHLSVLEGETGEERLLRTLQSQGLEAAAGEESFEAALCEQRVGVVRRTGVFWCVVAFAIGSLFLCGVVGLWWVRISHVKNALERAGAHYARIHPAHVSSLLSSTGQQTQSQAGWAEMLAWLTGPGVSAVRIDKGNLSDQQLRFVEQLRDVRHFELSSDLATDRTLELVSQLPKLRCLTIAGKSFSVRGLLKLRDAPCLSEMRFDPQHYSPIELAVLKAELTGVELLDLHPVEECFSPCEMAGPKTLAMSGEIAF